MTTSFARATNEEKGHGIFQLKANDQEMDKFGECVHKDRSAAEQLQETCDRRQPKAQTILEVAEAAPTDEEIANGGEQEVQQRHRLKSNEARKKLQTQSRFLESGPVEVNGATCVEFQRGEDLPKRLAERDGCPAGLRVREEELRASFQQEEEGSQQEKEDVVVIAPEAFQKQSEKLRELETNLMRLKEQTGNLEGRCVTTETKAGESSSLLCQLQTRLEYTAIELFEAKKLNAQMDAMKLLLEECEKELRHAIARGDLAERELKLREDHMEEADQAKKELEERLRWRNEQFISLEEAHSKLRNQLTEKCSEWDTERSSLFSDIDSLQSTLDSKECTLREAEKQLQMVHHALSREESRRKVLELEAAKDRQGLELATAGCEEVQTILETLRVQSSAEIGFLRNALGAKDRQLKDLHVRYVYTEQECNHLEEVNEEYRASPSNQAVQQQQSLLMKEEMALVAEAGDNLRSRMKALEIDYERERRALVKALDEAHDQVSEKDETLKQRDSELVRMKGALEHVQDNYSCLDIQLKQCETQLEGAYEETTTARQALASLEDNILVEKSSLLESLQGKYIVIRDLQAQIHHMEQTIAELSMHEEEHLLMQRDYKELQQRDLQQDARRKALESIHNSLLVRVSQEEKAWFAERKEILAESEVSRDRANAVETLLHEVRCENERHVGVIHKLEARCAFHDKEVVEHCQLADQTRKQLALERSEMEKELTNVRAMTESLSSALSQKDVTVEKLKDQIGDLEAELRRNDAENLNYNRRVLHLEKELKERAEILNNLHGQIALMKSQACQTAAELKLSEDVSTDLQEEMRRCQEQSSAAKADLDRKLEVACRDLSVLSMQQKAITQQLLDLTDQKELAVKDLDSKQSALTKLAVENKALLAHRDSLEEVVQVLETKVRGLFQEVESKRTTNEKLCSNYEASQSSLALSSNEVKVLQAKLLNAHTVAVQLRKAEEKSRDLEGYLKAAKAIAQDKEDKLAASEWAIQQLALDIGKAKAAVTQKAREEALVRDQLADVERQLRTKEGSYLEMECYLQEALMSEASMQREVDHLREQMEDLDRGAANWKREEQDLATQLQRVGAALEEKCVAILSCELEIKRGNELREIMNGAIDSLKLQLANEQRAFLAQQKDMNRLFEEHERSKGEANSAARLVKDLRERLELLEHGCGVRINQFQSALSESWDEWSLRRLNDSLEQELGNLKLLAEESQRQADEVAWKLAAALSDVAAKNVIVKQVNDENLGLRILMKDIEQETRSLQDGLHSEDHQQSTHTGDLTIGRDNWQQSTSPGKQRAEIQEELNNYLNLCDSLVRKNVRLEKQLDGLQRKNRGLQIQVVELQSTEASLSDHNRRAVDPFDLSPKVVLHGLSRKTDPRVDKAAFQEKTVTLQSIGTGKVLGEIDENAVLGSLDMCRMSQKSSVSPAAGMQRTKQKA